MAMHMTRPRTLWSEEAELRAKAAAAGHDPDEVVATDLTDRDGNHVEMPIWQTFFYGVAVS